MNRLTPLAHAKAAALTAVMHHYTQHIEGRGAAYRRWSCLPDHLVRPDPTTAEIAEYRRLQQQYGELKGQVDAMAIAAYERAWLAAHPSDTPQ